MSPRLRAFTVAGTLCLPVFLVFLFPSFGSCNDSRAFLPKTFKRIFVVFSDETTIKTITFSPLSLFDRRDYIQIGDKVTFQARSLILLLHRTNVHLSFQSYFTAATNATQGAVGSLMSHVRAYTNQFCSKSVPKLTLRAEDWHGCCSCLLTEAHSALSALNKIWQIRG